jgi:ketosteroid isomerase-like protein
MLAPWHKSVPKETVFLAGFISLFRAMSELSTLTIVVGPSLEQLAGSSEMEEEILKLEREFGQAIIKNDPDAISRFLADDWIIVDPDGGIIDKSRFLGVIRSGALTHEVMDSNDVRVRIYGDAAAVTALTNTKGKFMGQEFATQERATDVFVRQNGGWQCVVSQLTRYTKK